MRGPGKEIEQREVAESRAEAGERAKAELSALQQQFSELDQRREQLSLEVTSIRNTEKSLQTKLGEVEAAIAAHATHCEAAQRLISEVVANGVGALLEAKDTIVG